jgi:hypothetical protein
VKDGPRADRDNGRNGLLNKEARKARSDAHRHTRGRARARSFTHRLIQTHTHAHLNTHTHTRTHTELCSARARMEVIRPTAPGSPYRLPGLWRQQRPPNHQFAGTPAAELFRRQQSRDPHARYARQQWITSRRAAAEDDDRPPRVCYRSPKTN